MQKILIKKETYPSVWSRVRELKEARERMATERKDMETRHQAEAAEAERNVSEVIREQFGDSYAENGHELGVDYDHIDLGIAVVVLGR